MFSARCLWLGAAILRLLITSASTITYTPIKPPSYPIAVRSPYLSGRYSKMLVRIKLISVVPAWLPGNQVDLLPHSSP